MRHELLLVCTRGSCTPDAPTPMPDSVIAEERSGRHSEKPASFRQLIDRLYPIGPRLELFARDIVPEPWAVWGNQVPTEHLVTK
jgi:N6-adenosine-specific RNA methylase IME4